MKRAIKMGDKALTNPALRQEILTMLDKMMHLTTGDPSLLQRTRMGFQKAKKLPEEVDMDDSERESRREARRDGRGAEKADMDDSERESRREARRDGRGASNEEVEQIEEKSEKEVAKDLVALRATVDYHKDVERNWHKYGSFAQPRFRDNPAQLKAAEKGLTKANKDVKKTPVAKFLQTRKGDGKVRTEDVEKAPFEGGREVKSSKPAADRVKKIAKGMQKRFTEKK
jgi:hypothetical protein